MIRGRGSIPELLGSATATQALSNTVFTFAFAAPVLRGLLGWPGLIGAVCALVLVCAAVLSARREYIEWNGLLPLTLIAFCGWTAASLLWSDYRATTLAAILYQLSLAFAGVVVALTRDMIQLVRSVGSVLRVLLVISLLIEILAGITLDTSFPAIGVAGDLAGGGPIQGIFGTRNYLGFMATIALVTFLIERRTRTISRGIFVASSVLALTLLVFSRSPVAWPVFLVLGLATAVLYGLRQITDATVRRSRQYVLLGALAITALLFWLLRAPIMDLVGIRPDLDYRYGLWQTTMRATELAPVEGWGWAGTWTSQQPFSTINTFVGVEHDSALNAFVDVTLQLGYVGAALFAVLVIIAVGRSWLLASNRRNVTFTWPALMLIVMLATSAAESYLLVEGGWLLLVVCTVRAAQSHSWRGRLRTTPLPAPPLE